MVRVGINGFGRVGRQVLRQSLGRDDVFVVAVNSRADRETYCHLLRRDSTYGAFP
ncbi:MAG: glyceraldehyde 3-phosphate dehydrogenase NAD-binding domain-containing protein, partial [Bacillota bacterium]